MTQRRAFLTRFQTGSLAGLFARLSIIGIRRPVSKEAGISARKIDIA
jgi:hypothetical protein